MGSTENEFDPAPPPVWPAPTILCHHLGGGSATPSSMGTDAIGASCLLATCSREARVPVYSSGRLARQRANRAPSLASIAMLIKTTRDSSTLLRAVFFSKNIFDDESPGEIQFQCTGVVERGVADEFGLNGFVQVFF